MIRLRIRQKLIETGTVSGRRFFHLHIFSIFKKVNEKKGPEIEYLGTRAAGDVLFGGKLSQQGPKKLSDEHIHFLRSEDPRNVDTTPHSSPSARLGPHKIK